MDLTSTAPASRLRTAARRYLAAPDAVLPLGGPPEPLELAVATSVGLAGAGAFLVIVGIAVAPGSPAGSAAWWQLAAVPPVVALLSFPPLYLVTALQGRAPGLRTLAASASAGPTVAGTALGAASPLLLLYLLTGDVDPAFGLIAVLVTGWALACGASASVRNARRGGPAAPGPVTALAHYAFTLWTALAVAVHLF